MRIFCDAACTSNPGGSLGIGIVFIKNDEVVHEVSRAIGVGTSNIGEYTAVRTALEICVKHRIRSPHISTDSQLVVYQVDGRYGCDKEHLLPLRNAVRELLAQVGGQLTWVPREENMHADRLSKKAIALVILTDDLRARIAEIASKRNFAVDAVPERIQALLDFAITADDSTLADALIDLQAGRDVYSTLKGNDLRQAAIARHGITAIEAMEEELASRSDKTRTTATRFAARGFPPALAIAKVNLDKAARMPFAKQHAVVSRVAPLTEEVAEGIK